MDCCANYNRVFDQKQADNDLKRYRKKGLKKSSQVIVDYLSDKIGGMTVLEAGSGIGYLGMELVKNGARSALEIDISYAYLERAKLLRHELSLDDSVEIRTMDFVQHFGNLSDHDIVVSDKVICCLPNFQEFIEAGTARAKHYYALVYPRELVIWKMFVAVLSWVTPHSDKYKGFNIFIHPHQEINNLITKKGFEKVLDNRKGLWQISIYEKK